jgi:26S proteasome regulatory subunit N2
MYGYITVKVNSGVYMLPLAYTGTLNNDAIGHLLHISISDTSDDIRRAAVTSLTFLLFKNPGQVPWIIQLLSESYNTHVRCSATLALSIACAGAGLQDAVQMLKLMTKGPVDSISRCAFIALRIILVQQSEASSLSLTTICTLYNKVVSDKHEDLMAHFGPALGQGFIDAGGRNVTISLQSLASILVLVPLAHCTCLAFKPTGIIGLNTHLQVSLDS